MSDHEEAEYAVWQFERAWIAVLERWPHLCRDETCMDMLRAIAGGLDMKLQRRKEAA